MNAADLLDAMAGTYRERNAIYKDNYKRFGDVMAGLFPEGLNVRTKDEWNRICIFMMIMSKMTRYAANFHLGGHLDSIHDAGVYSAMLEELSMESMRKDDEGFVSSDSIRGTT